METDQALKPGMWPLPNLLPDNRDQAETLGLAAVGKPQGTAAYYSRLKYSLEIASSGTGHRPTR
jgi:hypothetical protein